MNNESNSNLNTTINTMLSPNTQKPANEPTICILNAQRQSFCTRKYATHIEIINNTISANTDRKQMCGHIREQSELILNVK